ncbi:MAG: hypothetical protein HY761_04840 [Candidatus Omnitrophica bacterium]|nr:hypothetical protein [Candidatus Omnitrophota bacterium]
MFSSRLFRNLGVGKIAKSAIAYFFLTVFIFIVIEGLASITLFFIDIFTPQQVFQQPYVQYDDMLGWVSKPNLNIKDLFGPGCDFKTNSQGFRNTKDFTVNIPPGKIRIICSGDSHTQGDGVSNDNTWCQILSSIDNKLETVNMGQGGYGVDQAYLRYMRDGRKLDHDIHIFAFIDDDFRRAMSGKFWSYQKPVFRLVDNNLVLDNVPVPKSQSNNMSLLTRFVRNWRKLQVFDLLKRIKNKGGLQLITYKGFDEEICRIALKIFESLHRAQEEKGSIQVALYIPTAYDYTYEVPWRKFLSVELAKRGIIFIDLTDEVVKRPVHVMFRDHYSEYGNSYLADTIYKKLLTYPEIRKRFLEVR